MAVTIVISGELMSRQLFYLLLNTESQLNKTSQNDSCTHVDANTHTWTHTHTGKNTPPCCILSAHTQMSINAKALLFSLMHYEKAN